MIELSEIQGEVYKWSCKNFPKNTSTEPLLGLVEEVGELCHAHLKRTQGSATFCRALQKDAVGDIMIYLMDYCSRENINLRRVLEETWNKVSKRD